MQDTHTHKHTPVQLLQYLYTKIPKDAIILITIESPSNHSNPQETTQLKQRQESITIHFTLSKAYRNKEQYKNIL